MTDQQKVEELLKSNDPANIILGYQLVQSQDIELSEHFCSFVLAKLIFHTIRCNVYKKLIRCLDDSTRLKLYVKIKSDDEFAQQLWNESWNGKADLLNNWIRNQKI